MTSEAKEKVETGNCQRVGEGGGSGAAGETVKKNQIGGDGGQAPSEKSELEQGKGRARRADGAVPSDESEDNFGGDLESDGESQLLNGGLARGGEMADDVAGYPGLNRCGWNVRWSNAGLREAWDVAGWKRTGRRRRCGTGRHSRIWRGRPICFGNAAGLAVQDGNLPHGCDHEDEGAQGDKHEDVSIVAVGGGSAEGGKQEEERRQDGDQREEDGAKHFHE